MSRYWLPIAFVVVLGAQDCNCAESIASANASIARSSLVIVPDTLEGVPGQTVRAIVRLQNVGEATATLTAGQGDLTPSFTPSSVSTAAPTAEMTAVIPATAVAGGRVLSIGVQARVNDALNITRTAWVRVLTPPSISASVSPTGLTIARGDTGSTTLSVTRAGGYTGSLAVQVEGLPSGVSVSGSAPGTGNGSNIKFTVATSASAGSSVLRIVVQGAGITTQTVPFTLTVADPPGFVLSAATGVQTVMQGATGDAISVGITRQGGFGGAVTLSVSGVPTGVTAAVTSPGTTNNGTLVFSATAATPKGTYPLTIRATASGLPEQSVPFSLTVAEPQGFTLTPETASQLVNAGTTAAPVRVAVSRQGGFTGAVTLGVGPLPAGVTVATTAPGAGNAGSFTFTASSTAVAGRYEMNVTGTASGVREQSVPFALIVGAAPTVALTLSAPTSLQVTRGGSSEVTIGVFRTGWTGAVTFTVSGAPSGMTATLVPASTTANFTVLRLAIGTGVGVGTYSLQIQATGANGTTAAARTDVVVQP